MTNSSHHFSTYNPCPKSKKIKITYGTLATITCQGTINLSPSFSLKSMLHMSKQLSIFYQSIKLAKI